MPDDFASARAKAIEVAEDNGFPNSGTSTVVVVVGAKPTQLKVTVSSRVDNAFAEHLRRPDLDHVPVRRRRLQRTRPHGQPVQRLRQRGAGQLQQRSHRDGHQGARTGDVPRDSAVLGAIAGPDVDKNQGRSSRRATAVAARTTAAAAPTSSSTPRASSTWSGSTPPAWASPVQLQVYDPAYVTTGARCTNEPYNNPGSTTSPPGSWGDTWNPRADRRPPALLAHRHDVGWLRQHRSAQPVLHR